MSRMTVIHYLNQFFAGIGGEDAAGLAIRNRLAKLRLKPSSEGRVLPSVE